MKSFVRTLTTTILFSLQVHAGALPPLHQAIIAGKAEQTEHLILSGVDVNEREPVSGMTPLMLASWLGQKRTVVNLLLHSPAAPHLIDYTGNTALMYAASQMDLAIISAILQKKPALNLQNHGGETALILAAKYGHRQTVLKLLSLGANPELVDAHGRRYSDWIEVSN